MILYEITTKFDEIIHIDIQIIYGSLSEDEPKCFFGYGFSLSNPDRWFKYIP